MDKRCGTCAYWEKRIGWSRDDNGVAHDIGACLATVPSSYGWCIPEDYTPTTKCIDGTACPCWQRKDATNG